MPLPRTDRKKLTVPSWKLSMEVTQELWNAVMPDDYALPVHKVGTLKPNSLGIYDMSGMFLNGARTGICHMKRAVRPIR